MTKSKSNNARMIRFTVSFAVYALLIYALSFMDNGLAGLAITVPLTFAFLAVNWVRPSRTRLTVLVLVAAFCALPRESQAQDNGGGGTTNKSIAAVVCGCVVLIGGAIIIISLKKMCNRIPTATPPDTEPPPPPPWIGNTNIINPSYPPYYMTNGVVVTNVVQRPRLALRDDAGVRYYSAPGGWSNPDGTAVTVLAKTVIETAPSVEGPWEQLYAVSAYVSAGGVQVVYRAPDGSMACSGFAPVSGGTWGQVAPLPVGDGDQRFYRLREP